MIKVKYENGKKIIAVLHLHLLMLHQVSFYELRYIFTYYEFMTNDL